MGKKRHAKFTATLLVSASLARTLLDPDPPLLRKGHPYDPKTFQAVSEWDDSDSSNSDGDDEPTTFHLGEFCAGRAEGRIIWRNSMSYVVLTSHPRAVYHELKHWPWSAHQEVLDKLKSVRKAFPKVQLPRGASKEERRAEEERVANLLKDEADRCAAELDVEGVVMKMADRYIQARDEATKAFAQK